MIILDIPLEYFLPKASDASSLTWGRTGPTTAQLSNQELMKRLSNVEVADARSRRDPTRGTPLDRRGINRIYAVLHQEAVTRGLREE